MDCLFHRLRRLRGPEPESPRYRRQRTARGDSQGSSDTSSYYSASSNFIDRVILGKHIYIRGTCEPEPDFSESDFVMDCLHWHNLFREKHGVPPLTLSNQLCNMAQFWANHLAHTNTFSHRNLRDIGENLFSKWSYIPDFDITGQQVSKYWYDEIKTYNFFQHPDLLHVKAGHFTQLVWRSSRDLGIGKARSRCGKVIVVANYRPAGNVVGQFHDNVLPPMNDADLFRDI